MILRARCILPMGDTPIENGAVILDGPKIAWLGRWQSCDTTGERKIVDLGEVALIPGLINSHCHLDYTNMAGQIPTPKYFPDWIKTILSFKSHWSFTEFAESWLKGARMLVDSGVTTVADIESVPELLKEVWSATPLRLISFLELTGVKSERSTDEILREALDVIRVLPAKEGKEAALSPHALYSTKPELVQKAVRIAREKKWLISTHLAESESEYKMFTASSGPFHDWLKGQRSMADCGHGSPIQLAQEYELLGDDLLAIHVNYLDQKDVELLAESRTNVVHCPRSHDYFGHDPFLYDRLKKAGVNISLGTDSLASCPKTNGKEPCLDLWQEMRLFAKYHPNVSPLEIFELVTLNAARALRKSGQIGQIKAGAFADVAALTYTSRVHERVVCETLLHESQVREVFIAGELARAV